MNVLFTLLMVVQVLSALAMIGLVLVQHGKGADAGAASDTRPARRPPPRPATIAHQEYHWENCPPAAHGRRR